MRIWAPIISSLVYRDSSLLRKLMKDGPVKNDVWTPIMVSAMYVPPVSERDLAKHSTNPVASPALNNGSVMVRTAVHLEAPSVMPAVSRLGSICSRMADRERTMYG